MTVALAQSSYEYTSAIASDRAGTIYVAADNDLGHASKVVKISASGSSVDFASGFSGITGLSADASGNVYVADYAANVVEKIGPGGSLLGKWANFNGPEDVDVDPAGNIYVADNGDREVRKIGVDGTISIVGSGFNSPADVAVDAFGNVYVVDAVSSGSPINNLKKVAADGSTSTVNLSYNNLSMVSIDAQGNVYVSDQAVKGIRKLVAAKGGAVASYSISPVLPAGLAIDATTGIISGTPTAVSAQAN